MPSYAPDRDIGRACNPTGLNGSLKANISRATKTMKPTEMVKKRSAVYAAPGTTLSFAHSASL